MESEGLARDTMENELFSERFLLKRPLLQAIEQSRDGKAPVLLIDELDRSDEEFEAFLLGIALRISGFDTGAGHGQSNCTAGCDSHFQQNARDT